jgi:hypothetical protein
VFADRFGGADQMKQKITYQLVGAGMVFGHADNKERAEEMKKQLEQLLICSITIKESTDERVSRKAS